MVPEGALRVYIFSFAVAPTQPFACLPGFWTCERAVKMAHAWHWEPERLQKKPTRRRRGNRELYPTLCHGARLH
ncbi:Hypothetical predicted protein [Podarcis lilfordi]|uniref:Uncharacterized protein n=1 Tax=Podarcis lilfordi TaxID=74358 RepID=A0AA35NVM6_9SAUR|nr:Hypothetical predicted protein [Podarcis lilfordi]